MITSLRAAIDYLSTFNLQHGGGPLTNQELKAFQEIKDVLQAADKLIVTLMEYYIEQSKD